MMKFYNDIKYACRMLHRAPGFTILVMGILAIGIAANTSLFSVVNAVILRSLPYCNSDRLVIFEEEGSSWGKGFSARENYAFLKENNDVFDEVAGYCHRKFYVEGIESPQDLRIYEVTANLFPLLGIQPQLGHTFSPIEESPQDQQVVVLSYQFWQEQLGGDSNVLGQEIILDEESWDLNNVTAIERKSYTIIGVMPADFSFPFGQSVAFWRPLNFSESTGHPLSDTIFPLARLKPGITLPQADANLEVLAAQLRKTSPEDQEQIGKACVVRLQDELIQGHRRLPLLLLGAAGFVLLIACSNTANLFLARATLRQREMAMRVALGASRGRLIRQVLTESLLLSLGAGLLGLALTLATVKTLVSLCPADIPRLHETNIDPNVLGFTLILSCLTGLVFGIMPAWRASEVCVNESLKEGAGRSTTGRHWQRLHGGLIISQLALSLILLIGATLLIRSLISLYHVDLGFQPNPVLACHIVLPQAKYNDASKHDAFYYPLIDRLRNLPGVESVAALYQGADVEMSLASTEFFNYPFCVEDQGDSDPPHTARFMQVTPDFFTTMGIPFRQGETLSEQGPDNAVIDEAFARECFGDTNPIGQNLLFQSPSGAPIQVIGVVDTVRSFDTPDPGRGVVYARGRGFGVGFAVILVRTTGDPANLIPAVRQQVAALEKDQVIKTIEPLDTTLSRMLAPERFIMLLLTLFALIALGLATIGLYGLLQYNAAQQTHDIGIRMALGAQEKDVQRMVLRRGLRLILIGIIAGVAGALALTRVLTSLLYHVTPTDPMTLVSVSIILSGIALLASYVPARRASKIDPMEALRYE